VKIFVDTEKSLIISSATTVVRQNGGSPDNGSGNSSSTSGSFNIMHCRPVRVRVVDAVTATLISRRRSSWIRNSNRNDFPVPAAPVMKIFFFRLERRAQPVVDRH